MPHSYVGLAGLLVLFVYVATCQGATEFFNPADHGGSMLAPDIGLVALGEPLNIIISNASSPLVLTQSGFIAYMQALNFSGECDGLVESPVLAANLGDGHGPLNQTATLRYNFGNLQDGTCMETLDGGNHLRFWNQNGSLANSSAWFLAVSTEQNLTLGHNIVVGGEGSNGYDMGRDFLAGNATEKSTSAQGFTFMTTATNVTGLLKPGDSGVNHGLSIDGIVTVLTVTVVQTTSNQTVPSASVSASGTSSSPSASGSASGTSSSPSGSSSSAIGRLSPGWTNAMICIVAYLEYLL